MNGRAAPVRSGVAVAAVAIGALALTIGWPALRSAPNATAELIGPDECRANGIGGVALKVDALAPGTTRHAAAGFAVTVTIRTLEGDDPTVDGDQTGSEVADFAASATVYGVVVKGGRSPGVYTYGAGGTLRAAGLHAPVNPANDRFPDISHLTFCHVAVAPTVTAPPPVRTDRHTPTPSERGGSATSAPVGSTQVPSPGADPATATPTSPATSPTETPGTPAASTSGVDPSRSAAAIDTAVSRAPGAAGSGTGGDDGSGVTLLGGDGDLGRLAAGLLVVAGIVLGLGALVARRRGQHRA